MSPSTRTFSPLKNQTLSYMFLKPSLQVYSEVAEVAAFAVGPSMPGTLEPMASKMMSERPKVQTRLGR